MVGTLNDKDGQEDRRLNIFVKNHASARGWENIGQGIPWVDVLKNGE